MKMKKKEKSKARVHFDTYGCSANLADSLYMRKILEMKGYEISSYEEADIVVINSCTVKNNAETKFFRALRKAKKDGKIPIAAGCVVDAQRNLVNDPRLRGVSILGTKEIDKIEECVRDSLKGKRAVLLDRKSSNRKSKNPHTIHYSKLNDAIAIIPLAEGCLGHCTYCKTKQARGELESYPKRDILCQITKFVEEGTKEIWLTSQDLGSYGLDKGGNLISLLKEIEKIEGEFWVRLGMSNPEHLLPIAEELAILISKSRHFFRFLHIPLQSGSNRILRLMGRNYSKEEFLYLILTIKKIIPKVTIATDIITGFPTEEEEDFKETLEVIKEIKPDVLNISRFWPRPNTIASRMKQLRPEIAIERARLARMIFKKIALEKNKEWLGWEGKAIIDEKGKKESLKGRNLWYKQLVFSKEEVNKNKLKIGQTVRTKVIKHSNFDLFCRINYISTPLGG